MYFKSLLYAYFYRYVKIKQGDSMFDNNDIIITSNVNKINLLHDFHTTLLNIKIYTLDEFNRLYYFDYNEETIYYVMNKFNVIYEVAKIYLDNMYYIEDKNYQSDKLSFLVSLKNELMAKHLLYHNPLFPLSLQNKRIIFYNLPHTKELSKLYSSLETITKVEYYDLEVKSYEHSINELPTDVIEVEFIANKICELVSNGVPLSKIYLTNLNSEYKKIIKRLFPMFHLPISLSQDETIYSTSLCTDFLNLYQSDLQVTITALESSIKNESSQNILNKIISIINKYTFVDDKNLVKEMIKYDLKNTKLDTVDIPESIHEVNLCDTVFTSEDYVFTLGFNQGILPVIHKDESYLSDSDRQELSISLTVDKNNLEKELVINKLSSIENLYLTYPLSSKGESLTVSSVNDTLKYPIIPITNIPLTNSNFYNQIKLTDMLDNFYKYGTISHHLNSLNNTYPNLPYNTYDNRFKSLNAEDVNNYLNNQLVLSYTSLDKYFKCPFSYYISKVLKLDIYEETFQQIVGSIFHSVLEKYSTSNRTYDELWTETVASFDYEFTIKDQFFLEKLKKELAFILETITEQEELTNLHDELHEEKINTVIDAQRNITFTGIIDKIKYKNYPDKTIAAIIDYKTGNPNLDLTTLPYGIGMQLPIYLYLAHHCNKLQNIEIAGFYLQKVLNNEITVDKTHTYEQLKKKNLLLQGYSNEDISILSEFDSSYLASSMIKGMRVKSDGDFYSSVKVLSNTTMNKLSKIAENKIKEGADLITSAEFKIAPKQIGNKEYGCNLCKFKDLCYRTNKDIESLSELTLDEIIGGEE